MFTHHYRNRSLSQDRHSLHGSDPELYVEILRGWASTLEG